MLHTLEILNPLRLIIEDDEGTTTIVPLGADAITIGRQQGNTIQLTEKNVSRRHARLYPDGEAWVIEDLGSYNGVKVNGHSVDGRVNLKEGDVVQIGDYHLALTEDVDKRSLNYDPSSRAANDNIEPMLASSSTDLPALSAEELAALQSGPHTPQPGSPALLDSGQMPAAAYHPQDEPRKGAGLIIGFGIAVIGLVAVGVVWLAGTGNTPAPEKPPVAEKSKKPIAPANSVSPPTKAVTPPPQPSPTPPEPVPTEPIADDSGAIEQPPPEIEVVDPPPQPPPAPVPVPETKATPKKPKQTPKKPKQPPPAPSPPKPKVDADALLADAKSLAFKNPAKAFDLAKKSYNAKKSIAAARIMATTACRLGDTGKAKYALPKVPAAQREQYAQMCRNKGVDV